MNSPARPSLFARLSRLARLFIPLAATLPAVAATVSLPVALDTPDLGWTSGGAPTARLWLGQTDVSHDGADSARSPALSAENDESWLETTVAAPGVLSWRWRLDSGPAQASLLEVYIGDETSARQTLFQNTGWTAASETLTGEGPVKVRWRFLRAFDSEAALADAAFLDTVSFAPFTPPVLGAVSGVTARGFTVNWTGPAAATVYRVELSATADFSAADPFLAVPAPASSWTLTELQPLATYYFRVVAHGPDLLEAASAAGSVTLPAIQRPTNDAFAAPVAIAGVSGTIDATTLDATIEDGEPVAHDGSVWFTWTAPGAGRWRFTAAYTASGALGSPALRAYTGSTLAGLSLLADHDGSGLIEFDVAAGAAVRIAVDSYPSDAGPVRLVWTRLATHTPPANDAFAAGIRLTGASGSATGSNLHAGVEAGEPASTGAHTVWWRWTAPSTGLARFDATASAIPATIGAFTGANLAGLVPTGADEGVLSFPVTANITYHLVLSGVGDAQGALSLAWTLTAASQTQTIAFAPISERGVHDDPFQLSAEASSGLPVTFALLSGPASLDGDLLTLSGGSGTVKLRATQAGDGLYLPASADIEFAVRPVPANDAFAAATPITGLSGSVSGNNLSASAQDLDPFPARRSVWWAWNAPATGVLTLDTAGSSINTTLAVVTPRSADDPLVLAESGLPGIRAKLEVPVSAGVAYRIAVDSYDQAGAVSLSWSFAAPTREQTITFTPLPDAGVDAAPVTLDAYSDSGLPITFSLVSGQTTAGVAQLDADNGVLSFTGKTGVVTVRASQAGDSYYKPAQADVTFTIRPAPANDAFASAATLTGASGVTTGANVDASAEFADPYPASHSVWWRWTAPSAGVLTLDTAGSGIFTTMGVFTGASADALVPVASAVEPATHARLEFPVEAGVTYRIVVDALDNAQGALRLAWTFQPPSLVQTIDLAAPADRVAGDEPFEVSATASSGLPVTLAVTGPATLADGVLTLTHQPGVVTLRATQPGDAYYKAAAPVVRTFKVAKAPAIKFAFSGLSRTYDGAAHSVDVVATPAPRFAEVALTYSGPGYPASAEPPVRAGTYTVTATADGSKQTAKLVIAKAPLTVTAIDRAKLAGAPLPDFPLEYTGFVGTDDADSLARKPVATTPAKATSPGGKTYPIRPSGGVSTDYAFTYVPGVLTVETLAGRYEAMLADPSSGLPVAKLVLAIAAGGNTWTGQLVTRTEPAAFPVKGPLVVDSDAGSSTGSVTVKRGANIYRLDLAILRDTRFQATLALGDTTLAATTDGRRVFVPAAKEKLSWTGAHTLLLRDPVPLDLEDARPLPAGLGHATAAIDAKGNLKLAGTLADGAKLTATLAPDDTGAYRLFALPYAKRLHSYVAGTLPLENHPDLAGRRYLPATDHDPVVWLKAALPSTTKPAGQDKSTRAGFALDLSASIDPWLPPVPKTSKANPAIITLAQRLGLATANDQPASLALAYGPAEADFGALASELPDHLDLSVKNVLTLPANATKLGFTLTSATGAFKGRFTLIDQVPAPTVKNPEATKTEKRVVEFSGVLRQPPVGETAPLLGGGAFLLKPLSTAETTDFLSGHLLLAEP